MGSILQSLARDESGKKLHAVDARKGGSFFCGLCKDSLILRKSGNTGPRSKRPHFAHKALSPNCSPESAMHFEFKTMLAGEIERRIVAGIDLPIGWMCSHCKREHSGNLTKKAHRVALEYSFGVCRPDLALFDEHDKPIAVIEVVVTHSPERAAQELYRSNAMPLIELRITSDDDLTDVAAKLTRADSVDLCLSRKRCPRCRYFQRPVEMKMVLGDCHSCGSAIKMPFIEGDYSRGTYVGPDGFSPQELKIAREHGALIEWQFSGTMNTSYWAVTCGRCKKFVGRHFVFTEYIAPLVGERVIAKLRDFCECCYERSLTIED